MGGLVVKNAFLLARTLPHCEPLIRRISAIFFIATPHQGSHLVQTLKNVISLSLGPGAVVHNLTRDSLFLETINMQFPDLCRDVQLFSFFESKPTNPAVGLVVEKQGAVMNCANESKMHINADHRNTVRFSSVQDPSYIKIRNALATCIARIRKTKDPPPKRSMDAGKELAKFIGISEAPEDEISTQDSFRLPGTGEWLLRKATFQQWLAAPCSTTLWLHGRPGSGKSYLAGRIVSHLRNLGRSYCFFFFNGRDRTKSSINTFLRSMAWQMAGMHDEIMAALATLSGNWQNSPVDKVDHGPIWRQIYSRGILKARLDRPQYWVIDALDECEGAAELLALLAKVQEVWPLCILIFSRNPPPQHLVSSSSKIETVAEAIKDEDTDNDVLLFLKAKMDHLPSSERCGREVLANRIFRNSSGCFLWVDLVCKELIETRTESEMERVLSMTPEKMDQLYSKILTDMADAKFGKKVVKAILTWVTCSFRPLTVDEIHRAVEIDLNEPASHFEKSLKVDCSSLLYIDSCGKVQLTHSTARDFLMNQRTVQEFIIDKAAAHKQLAFSCLQHLSGNEMRTPRRGSLSVPKKEPGKSPIHDYACRYLFNHLVHVRSYDDIVLVALYRFLTSENVLIWMEYLAAHGELHRVFSAGKTINSLLNRRRQHSPPLAIYKEISVIERWGNDLVHLVTKFGKHMSLWPSSIHYLIPPFCPQDSVLRKQFSTARSIAAHGFSGATWDDCVSVINFDEQRATAVDTSEHFFAVGMRKGKILVYDHLTCQEVKQLDQKEPVRCLACGDSGQYLAESGSKTLRVWEVDSWTEILNVPLMAKCIALAFTEDDQILLIATEANQFVSLDIITGHVLREDSWILDFEEHQHLRTREPSTAVFSPNQQLLAIVYRGEDILLWDYEKPRCHAVYEKGVGSRGYNSSKLANGSTTVRSLTFSPAIDTNLLIASYTDGDVVVYDTYGNVVVGSLVRINTRALSCSSDGRTLVTADTKGAVQLFDLETLKLIYRIRSDDDPILIVTFTSDSQRVIDIRHDNCMVWEPAVLQRQDMEDDENSDTVSVSTVPHEVEY